MTAPEPPPPSHAGLGHQLTDWCLSQRQLVAAMVASSSVCLLWGAFRFHNFPLDDAYIHLSYGKYFQWGSLPSFNGDGADTGSSSWLWTALCIAIEQARLPAVPALTVIEVLLLGWVVYQLMRLTAELVPPATPAARAWPYLSAALLLTDGNLLWLALSGMESTLLCALMLGFCRQLFDHPRRAWRLGLLALALVCTRLEAIAWVLLALPLTMRLPAARRPRAWCWLLPGTGVALQLGYNFAVGGGLLPTTATGKTGTYVASAPKLAAVWHFVIASYRDYLRPHLLSWAVLLLLFSLAVLVLSTATLRAALRQRPRGRLSGASPAELSSLLIVLGTVGHSGAYLLFFRTSYHHFRYFTPLLVVSVGLAAPLVARALDLAARALARRVRARWRRLSSAATASVLATGAALLLWQSGHECRFWQRLLVLNTVQLERVHIAAGRWLAANRRELERPVVAGFDIGALRYFSGMQVVDLGGLLERRAAGPRWRETNSALVAQHRAAVVASLDNGFDRLPSRSWRYGFELEPLVSFAFREYHDPFPPHSKIIRLLRVNHCGEPRLRRLRIGTVMAFDSNSRYSRGRAGHGHGTSFADWPTLGPRAKPKLYRRHGRGYLSSYDPDLGGAATGEWESIELPVVGDWLGLFIAGGGRRGLGVEVLSSSGAVIQRWPGYGMPVFVEERLSLAGHRGERLRLRVTDQSTHPSGYLAIDDIQQYRWADAPPWPCR